MTNATGTDLRRAGADPGGGGRPFVRIVAGRFKGTALATPNSQGTRPTSDRLRETIFNILGTWSGS